MRRRGLLRVRWLLRMPGLLWVLAACLVAAGCGGGRPAAGEKPPAEPAAAGRYRCLGPEQARTGLVRFPDGLGDQLDGYLEGSGEVGVVLAHQRGGDLCMWQPHQSVFAAAGYLTLSFTTNGGMDENTSAAVAELRRRGARTVLVVGASLGGGAALYAAAKNPQSVTAVVALSPVEPPAGTLAKLTQPVLFVVSEGDFSFADTAKALYPQVRTPGTRLETLGGALHGIAMLDRSTTGQVLDFLAAHRADRPLSAAS